MKLQPTSAIEYEVIEPGVYEATIDSVVGKDPNPSFDDAKPQLQFVFEIAGADVPIQIYAWTGQTYGPKSKLRPWLKVILPDFDPDQDTLDTDDLIGKTCRIVVVVKTGADGKERNRVSDVLPRETRRRPERVAAVQEPVPTVAQRRAAQDQRDPQAIPF